MTKLEVRPRVGDVIKRRRQATVVQWLNSHIGCHGHQSLQMANGQLPEVPGWDLPPGTEVTIEIRVTVTKVGRRSRKRCENPWPSHRCD